MLYLGVFFSFRTNNAPVVGTRSIIISFFFFCSLCYVYVATITIRSPVRCARRPRGGSDVFCPVAYCSESVFYRAAERKDKKKKKREIISNSLKPTSHATTY